MAQIRVTSPVDIYDTLSDDTEFMSYIGDYYFKGSNSASAAFSVVTPNVPIPNLEYVDGLEVVIHDTGSVDRLDFLTDASIPLVTYQIYLILWSPGVGSDLTNATSRIVSLFSGARSILTVPINKTPNVAMQSIVEVPGNALILV